MVVDIRAQTVCNLGVVVQGAISDESLSPGQGLIRCRGQLVIDELITPSIGTVVHLAYVRDGRIVRVPRKLRVLSSFADPFRNITTVQVGDKLVWLANKGPNQKDAPVAPIFPDDPEIGDIETFELPYPQPTTGDPALPAQVSYSYNGICWQPQNKDATNSFRLDFPQVTPSEQVPARPADEQLRAPVTIAGWTIASKCLAGLGLTSIGITQIVSQYNEQDAVISGSYVSTLETLLGKEGLVGYLDANEVLRVKQAVIGSSTGGIYLTEDDIADISPIGFGEVPAEAAEVVTRSAKSNEPVLDPDPQEPEARDFRIGPRQQGTEFQISYNQFLINSTFDRQSYLYNKINVNATAGAGCSVEALAAGILVEVTEDYTGIATLSYTISDGNLTSDSATVEFNVLDSINPPDDTEIEGGNGLTLGDLQLPDEGQSSVPAEALAGTEIATSTGSEDEIIIEYVTLNGNNRTAKYTSFPSSTALVTYGKYGEVLTKTEIKKEAGAVAAANVFLLWLKYGELPKNIEVHQISVTDYYYDYSFEGEGVDPAAVSSTLQSTEAKSLLSETGLLPQSSQCVVNGICQAGASPPPNPQEGDVYKFGDCQYTYNSSTQRWEPSSEEPGEGVTVTEDNPDVPSVDEAQFVAGRNLEPYQTVTTLYEHAYYISGSMPWNEQLVNSTYLSFGSTSAVPPLPDWDIATERTIVNYKTYVNESNLPVQQVDTYVYKARYKTIEGQQYLASLVESIPDLIAFSGTPGTRDIYSRILYYALELVEDNNNSSVSVGRVADGESAVSGSSTPVVTDPEGNVFATPSGSTLATAKPVLPRVWDRDNGYQEARNEPVTVTIESEIDPLTDEPIEIAVPSWSEQNDETLQQKLFESRRAIQFGNRYGLALQVAPWSLPMYPMSPIYIDLKSVVGAFRANGISIAFSSDGILANCDALLVGGVGGTGVPWFPLPDGTTLPEASEPTVDGEAVPANSIAVPESFDPNNPGAVFSSLPADEDDSFVSTLEPDGVVLSDPVSYRIFLGVRVGMAFDKLSWSLTPQIKDQALGVKTGLVIRRETKVMPPAASVAVAGAVPVVSGGASIRPAAVSVAVEAAAPAVVGGASVAVPAVDIAVAPAPGPVVPRESTVVLSPAVDVEVAAAVPVVSGGASVAVPVIDVTVAAAVPTVSMVAPPLMKVLLYTGNGSTNTQTGVGFEPGLVWTKRRTSSVADHAIYDYVQGTTKYWRSNQAAAQVTDANSLTAFSSDGFTLGSAAISNTNSASYVAWCLTKGGTSSSNTDGSITTTVYANSTAGYNIFTYTGTGANATIGHGLGASPELVFIRNLGAAQSTAVGGDFLANNEYIFLGTSGKASSATVFQSYSSTTISVGSNSSVNGNGNSMLGYAFKSVAGNTDIGTYTGTGTTDQSITCGFAPQFVLIKVYSTTGSWMIFDNTRGVTLQLAMGENSIESTVDKVTLDANGFTVKANQNTNTNAATYVYLAIR